MTRTDHICLMAKYNEWMNAKLYQTAMRLSGEELVADRGAFFGSILGTLNHIVAGDTIWLRRFATHPANYLALETIRNLPAPTGLDQQLFIDIQTLEKHRKLLDQCITEWAHSVTEPELDHRLHYANSLGVVSERNFYGLVLHFFNHQTHHRGQVTTLLSQAHVDVGVTDLVVLVPNEAA